MKSLGSDAEESTLFSSSRCLSRLILFGPGPPSSLPPALLRLSVDFSRSRLNDRLLLDVGSSWRRLAQSLYLPSPGRLDRSALSGSTCLDSVLLGFGEWDEARCRLPFNGVSLNLLPLSLPPGFFDAGCGLATGSVLVSVSWLPVSSSSLAPDSAATAELSWTFGSTADDKRVPHSAMRGAATGFDRIGLRSFCKSSKMFSTVPESAATAPSVWSATTVDGNSFACVGSTTAVWWNDVVDGTRGSAARSVRIRGSRAHGATAADTRTLEDGGDAGTQLIWVIMQNSECVEFNGRQKAQKDNMTKHNTRQ